MSDIRKFQSLELDQKYQVKSYTEPFKTKFGECIILRVSKEESEEVFELYATKLLKTYIEEKSTGKFNFIVKGKDGTKYPYIEGYAQERKWIDLE